MKFHFLISGEVPTKAGNGRSDRFVGERRERRLGGGRTARHTVSRLLRLDHASKCEIDATLDGRRSLRHLMEPEALCLACHYQPMPVCVENLVRIDLMGESLNVGLYGRAALFLPDAVGLAVQVEELT